MKQTRDALLNVLTVSEQRRQAEQVQARRTQLAAEKIHAQAVKEIKRLDRLCDHPDSETRASAKAAYLRAVQTRANAARAHALAAKHLEKLASM